MATYYETLGIDSSATAAEIDRAYRFLAQKFHPDANPGSEDIARKRFQVVQEAFEVLSDSHRRREYDAKLGAGLGPEWERIPMNTDNGGIRFNSDGSIHVAGLRIPPEEAVPKASVGPATIEKDAGPSGEFRVWHGGKQHRFRYANNAWHAYRERNKGQAKAQPQAQPSREPGPISVPMQGGTISPLPVLPKSQSHPVRNMLIAGVLLAIGLGGGFYASRSGSATLAVTPEEQRLQKEKELADRKQLAELDAKIQEQAAIEGRQRQSAALARDRILAAKRVGEGALASANGLTEEMKLWSQQIEPLLTNDEGRKLATSEQNLRVFKSLQGKQRLSSAEAIALRTEIESLLNPITEALASATAAVGFDDEISARLLEKKEEAERHLGDLRQTREAIRNLVVLSAGVTPSAKTLQQALADLALTDAQREADLIARTEKETREAASIELAQARKTLLEAEALRERTAVEGETAAVQARAEHEKNLEEAKTTKVQNALRFFLTPGYYQPGGRGEYTKTIEPHPISYSTLLAYGALEKSNQGLARLLFVVTNLPEDRRTRWKFPRFIGSLSPDQTEQLVEAQGYLRRLGDALVELKLLDP